MVIWSLQNEGFGGAHGLHRLHGFIINIERHGTAKQIVRSRAEIRISENFSTNTHSEADRPERSAGKNLTN